MWAEAYQRSFVATNLIVLCFELLVLATSFHDIEKLHRKYGPILRIAPNEATSAKDGAWNDIFRPHANHQPFLKDPPWWSAQPGHPVSLIYAIDTETHARIRKVLAPAFTPRALRSQEPIVQRYVNFLMEKLEEKASEATPGKDVELDIAPWMNFTAFDIFGDLGFGESFDCLQHSQYHPWIALLLNSVKAASFVVAARFYPWVEWALMNCIPPSLQKVQQDHYQQIVDKVDRRLNWEVERPDIMSPVIQQCHDGKGMSTGEINSTFMVLTTAGSETTATTLCGAVNYLAAHPEKRSHLAREIRETFQSREEISLDALRDLTYLNAVLQENIEALSGSATPVSIQAWTLNRDPEYFRNASSFEPERWLPDASTNPSSPYYHDRRHAIQPFSTSPRNCLGQHLTWAEMRLILSKLIWTFDFEPVGGKMIRWEEPRTFLLVEKRPIMVQLKTRIS